MTTRPVNNPAGICCDRGCAVTHGSTITSVPSEVAKCDAAEAKTLRPMIGQGCTQMDPREIRKMTEQRADYTGKVVFLERDNSRVTDPKNRSTHGNGEYLVVRQTPGNLYVVKLDPAVYGLASGWCQPEAKPFNGNYGSYEETYVVREAFAPTYGIESIVREAYFAACAIDRGEKLSWVETVYRQAKMNIERLAERMNINLGLVPTPGEQKQIADLYRRLIQQEATIKQLTTILAKWETAFVSGFAGISNTLRNGR